MEGGDQIMANSIDQRVVQMEFDNSKFEKNASTTQKTLQKLKEALKFNNAGKGLEQLNNTSKKMNFSALERGVQAISDRFSSLGIIGMTVLQNLTNSAINAGKSIASALTIDPIKTGFQEYETQINAVQTILANTQSKGTNLQQVNAALDELNHYADMTIYNFTEMTRNIGTFTAAGVDLDTSVSAIKGIANLAAVSGSNSQQASTAMYQLSQALASGTVKLQDWNSVVNAGMGGQVFQDALKETARVHGVKIDEMIEKEGSFRETLSNGWLTSAVLTETLAKFTGDLSEEQLRSIGYTDEQIQGIMEMGRTANDAATKVKTFTQLFDTLKEAAQSGWTQSWEIIVGDFEEAKELLTSVSDVISGMLNDSANARNEVLQGWKDLGGRTDLIDAFKNMFDAIIALFKPIHQAFEEIIPPITAEKLANLTAKFKSFTSTLIINEETADKVRRTFRGVFSIFSIIGQVVGSVIKVFSKLIPSVGKIGGSFLDVTAAIGDFISGINEAIKKSGLLSAIGNTIGKVFSKIASLIGKVTEGIGKAFSNLSGTDTSGITEFFNSVFEKIRAAFSKIRSIVSDFLKNFNFSQAIGAALAGLSGGLIFKLIKLVSTLKEKLEDAGDGLKEGFGDKIKTVLDGVSETLQTFIGSIKVGMLLKIAIALGILSAALYVLAGIDTSGLAKGLVAIAVLFQEMFVFMQKFTNILDAKKIASMSSLAIGLIGLGIAVNILASAVKKLGELSWEDLIKGLGSVMILILEISAFLKLADLEKVGISQAAGLLIIAAAINILASAVSNLSVLSYDELIKGLGSVAILLLEIVAFTNLMGESSANMIAIGVGILALSAGIFVLSNAVASFGQMDIGSLVQGLLGMAAALLLIAGAMQLMPDNLLSTGAGLLVVAASMLVLSSALQSLGSMSIGEICASLITLAASLLIIGAALIFMQGTIGGAAALLVASVALMALATALKILGSMSLGEIVAAIGTLAASLAVLGASAVVLTPVIPAMLGLAAAIALLGVGLLAIGAGVAAFSAGMMILATTGAAGVAALQEIVNGIITLIPQAATALAEALIQFLNTIVSNAPQIVSAIIQLISEILTSLNTLIPQVVTLCQTLITEILGSLTTIVPQIATLATQIGSSFIQGLTVIIPQIITFGTTVVMSLINAITTIIPQIAAKGIEMVTGFINGIAAGLPLIIQAGFNLVINFLNGLADGIRNNTQTMIEAFKNLFDAMVNAAWSFLSSTVGGFLAKGGELINGVINGIRNGISGAIAAVTDVVNNCINTIKNFVSNFMQAGKDLIQGFIDGIKNALAGVGSAVAGAAEAAKNTLCSLLGIASPSRVFKEYGKFTIQGFIIGIQNMVDKVVAPVKSVGRRAIDTMKYTLNNVASTLADGISAEPTITPVLDLTEVDKGIDKIYSSFNKKAPISFDVTAAKATAAIRTNDTNSDVITGSGNTIINNYDMTQNNYSPKTLSRYEIYRQTKNQFSRLKGATS